MFKYILKETTLIVNARNVPLPITVTLKSSDPVKAIELSTDDGVEYFLPVYDITSATMLILSITSPLTNIKFTGSIGDIALIR